MRKTAKTVWILLPAAAVLLLLTAYLLLGLTGCSNGEETTTAAPAQSAAAETTAAPTTPATLQAPVMETEDWDAYTPTKYQGKEQLPVTLDLTADLTAQDTILYQDGSKYAELVGVIVPTKDQTAFDNLELNKDYNGVEYKEKGTGTLPNGTRYTYIMSDLPTETGSWYAYCYALPAGDNLLLLTLYKTEKQSALSSTDAALLQSAAVS